MALYSCPISGMEARVVRMRMLVALSFLTPMVKALLESPITLSSATKRP
jgi:hypothetical protein